MNVGSKLQIIIYVDVKVKACCKFGCKILIGFDTTGECTNSDSLFVEYGQETSVNITDKSSADVLKQLEQLAAK